MKEQRGERKIFLNRNNNSSIIIDLGQFSQKYINYDFNS